MPSSGALRQQIYRQRKKRGLQCIQVEIRQSEIQTLVNRGLLAATDVSSAEAIRMALYTHFDRTLVS
jgi:hypothetical protein